MARGGRGHPRQAGGHGGGRPAARGGRSPPHGIERLRQFFPSLPLLVYTELAPATAGVLLELGRTGIRRVIVHRFEDAPGSLRRALLAELEHSASQQVIQGLGNILRELPPELRLALEGMLHAPGEGPPSPRSPSGLSSPGGPASAGSPRWVAVAAGGDGADPPAVRASAAARPRLHGRGRGNEAGIQQDEDAADASRAVFGLTAGELRVSLSIDEAMDASPADTSTPLQPGRHREPRVLIVDDEPALRRTLERALRGMRYEVVTAADPQLAYGAG